MLLHSQHIFSPNISLTHSHLHHPSTLLSSSSSSSSHFFNSSPRTHLRTRLRPCFAQLSEPTMSTTTTTATTTRTPPPEEGPVELPPSSPSLFANTDDPSPLQVATSVLLTGSITIFLFRSLRRRAKRAKELKFRSSGVKKNIKEEALDSLNAMKLTPIESETPPSPVQALLGGLTAGIITLILYKFTTTIEAALNRQTMSDSFSVQQITITIRTIINGLCYLATFVFGINSIGLILYSAQLVLNSLTEGSNDKETSVEDDGIKRSSVDSEESRGTNEDNS